MACGVILQTLAFLACVGTGFGDASSTSQSKLRTIKSHLGSSIQLRSHDSPRHTLRVCNAYPYSTPLEVFIGHIGGGQEKLTDPPMVYKTCREFKPQLKSGDRVDFRFKEESAGIFVVKDLPATDAVLMLVIYRHNTKTTAVAFESHIFSNLLNGQIAVLDTYKGPEQASMRIQDQQDASTARSELLTSNSVVAVQPGKYEVVLAGPDGMPLEKSDLSVDNKESCVVIRCGVHPEQGKGYKEELLVYPPYVHKPAKSAAMMHRRPTALLLLLCVVGILAQLHL